MLISKDVLVHYVSELQERSTDADQVNRGIPTF